MQEASATPAGSVTEPPLSTGFVVVKGKPRREPAGRGARRDDTLAVDDETALKRWCLSKGMCLAFQRGLCSRGADCRLNTARR